MPDGELKAGIFERKNPKNIEKLEFSSPITVTRIGENALDKLQGLEVFYGDKIGLKQIEAQTFHGLRNLTHFYLAENEISSIAEGSFDDLELLRVLDLEQNHIKAIPSGLFAKTTELKTINLSKNLIVDISNVELPPDLLHFHLDKNYVKTLELKQFSGLKNLNELHLSRNEGAIVLPPAGIVLSARNIYAGGSTTAIEVNKANLLEVLKRFENLESITLTVNPSLSVEDLSFGELHQSCPHLLRITINGYGLDCPPPPPTIHEPTSTRRSAATSTSDHLASPHHGALQQPTHADNAKSGKFKNTAKAVWNYVTKYVYGTDAYKQRENKKNGQK